MAVVADNMVFVSEAFSSHDNFLGQWVYPVKVGSYRVCVWSVLSKCSTVQWAWNDHNITWNAETSLTKGCLTNEIFRTCFSNCLLPGGFLHIGNWNLFFICLWPKLPVFWRMSRLAIFMKKPIQEEEPVLRFQQYPSLQWFCCSFQSCPVWQQKDYDGKHTLPFCQ